MNVDFGTDFDGADRKPLPGLDGVTRLSTA